MEYTACVDRLEEGVLVFVCDGGEVFTAPHSPFPNLKEGQRCVLTVKAEQVTAAKASAFMVMMPWAVASRAVTGFSLTSTITAFPAASKCVRLFSLILFHLS